MQLTGPSRPRGLRKPPQLSPNVTPPLSHKTRQTPKQLTPNTPQHPPTPPRPQEVPQEERRGRDPGRPRRQAGLHHQGEAGHRMHLLIRDPGARAWRARAAVGA